MTETLMMLAKPDVAEIAFWAVVDNSTQTVTETGTGMPAPHPDVMTVLVLHGTNVGNIMMALPKRVTTQVRQALPTLLEDVVATQSGDIHTAVGGRTGDTTLVAVTSMARMKALVDQLASAGHSIRIAAPDYMLLAPTAPDEATLIERDGYVIAALGGARGGTIESDLASHALPDLLNGVKTVTIFGDIAHMPDDVSASCQPAISDRDYIMRLADAAQHYAGPNLLQGDFSQRRRLRLAWPNWKRTAALTAVFAVLLAGYYIAEGFMMTRQAGTLDSARQARMQAAFPGVRNLSHFRAKVRQLEARDEDPFLRLSAVLFTAVTAQDGSASLQEIGYDGLRKELVATLTARSMADVEAIQNTVASTGDIRVSQRQARPGSGGQTVTLALEVAP